MGASLFEVSVSPISLSARQDFNHVSSTQRQGARYNAVQDVKSSQFKVLVESGCHMSDLINGEVLVVRGVTEQPFGGMVYLSKEHGAEIHIASLDEYGQVEFLQENTIYVPYDRLQYAMKMRPFLGGLEIKRNTYADIVVSSQDSERIQNFFTKHGIVIT